MVKNVLYYLEESCKRYADKVAYADENRSITYKELYTDARKIASCLLSDTEIGVPVLVWINKSVECIEAFLGVLYTGAFYVPVDVAMPEQRINLIRETLETDIIVTSRNIEIPDEVIDKCKIYYIEEMLVQEAIYSDRIAARQRKVIDTDPMYAIFTSGSTGIPKGVLVSHHSVINFTEWYCETFGIDSQTCFANQTPFYFDASVKEIYPTLRCGATMNIVPKKLFSLPGQLVRYLNEYKINCINWVPSVLCMIVQFHTLEKEKPKYLKKALFFGEVMPTKQFNVWRKALPEVEYINMYGPTEATVDVTYYKIERELMDSEPIPIGYACDNTDVLLLDESGQVVQKGEVGEICARGRCLALGYWNDQERTARAFVQNPLQKHYKEYIYRTGDLAKINEYDEIIFLSRKDSQIKHQGHRIELGEIETAIGSISKIERICCLFDNSTNKIIAVYQGDISSKEIITKLRSKIPAYMLPNIFHQEKDMPLNINGKLDRALLKERYVKKGE